MSNIEHLLENAIDAIEGGKSYEEWLKEPNKSMLKSVMSTPEEIWAMAQYCVFTYRTNIIGKTIDYVEKQYGYSLIKYN